MKRRDFIALVGGAAATWPLVARAQQAAVPVIGFLGSESPDVWASRVRAFHQGLGETGYVEGKNVRIEYRWAEGNNDRLAALAADLVARQVAVVAVNGDPGTRAAKGATGTIPVVFQIGGDPVAAGLVESLNQPGGNVTGVTGLTGELVPKRLEVLHELVATRNGLAVLVNPTNPIFAQAQLNDAQAAGRTLGLQVQIVEARNELDLDSAFASVAQSRAGGLSNRRGCILQQPNGTARTPGTSPRGTHGFSVP